MKPYFALTPALFAGVLLCSTMSLHAAPLFEATWQWRDDDGKAVHFSEWRDKPMIVTMAYINCRKLCPLTLHQLEQLQAEADKRHFDAEFVVIGYDPEHETPADWHDYRLAHKLLRSNWHFLTGSDADTHAAAQALGMPPYWNYDEHVMHEYKIVLVDQQGQVNQALTWAQKHAPWFAEVLNPSMAKMDCQGHQ